MQVSYSGEGFSSWSLAFNNVFFIYILPKFGQLFSTQINSLSNSFYTKYFEPTFSIDVVSILYNYSHLPEETCCYVRPASAILKSNIWTEMVNLQKQNTIRPPQQAFFS